jgi:hypothetical protein
MGPVRSMTKANAAPMAKGFPVTRIIYTKKAAPRNSAK